VSRRCCRSRWSSSRRSQMLMRRTASLAAKDLHVSLICQFSSHSAIVVSLQPPLRRPAKQFLGLMVSWRLVATAARLGYHDRDACSFLGPFELADTLCTLSMFSGRELHHLQIFFWIDWRPMLPR
jgi:hypothetical protein